MRARLYRPHAKEYCIGYQSRHGTLRGIHNDWCEVPINSSCSWENQQHGRGHHVKVVLSDLQVGAVVRLRLMHEDETSAPAFTVTKSGGQKSTMLVGVDPRDWREGLTWTSKDQEGPRKWHPAASFLIRVVAAGAEARCIKDVNGDLIYLLPADQPAVIPVRVEVLSACKGAGNFARYCVVCDNAHAQLPAEHLWKSPPILIEAKWLPAAPVREQNKKRFNRLSAAGSSSSSSSSSGKSKKKSKSHMHAYESSSIYQNLAGVGRLLEDESQHANGMHFRQQTKQEYSSLADDDSALRGLVDSHMPHSTLAYGDNSSSSSSDKKLHKHQQHGAFLVSQVVQHLRNATLSQANASHEHDTFVDAVPPKHMRLLETAIFDYKLARACSRGKSPSLGPRPVPTPSIKSNGRKQQNNYSQDTKPIKRRKKKKVVVPNKGQDNTTNIAPLGMSAASDNNAVAMTKAKPGGSTKNHKLSGQQPNTLSSPPRSPALSAIMRSSLPHEMFAKFDMLASAASSGFMPPIASHVGAGVSTYSNNHNFDQQTRGNARGRLEAAAAAAATAVAANEHSMFYEEELEHRSAAMNDVKEIGTTSTSRVLTTSTASIPPSTSSSSLSSAGCLSTTSWTVTTDIVPPADVDRSTSSTNLVSFDDIEVGNVDVDVDVQFDVPMPSMSLGMTPSVNDAPTSGVTADVNVGGGGVSTHCEESTIGELANSKRTTDGGPCESQWGLSFS